MVLRSKDSEDNMVVLIMAHEESILSWNRSYLLIKDYRSDDELVLNGKIPCRE